MNVLAFETSTEACSVALHTAGGTIERFELAPRRHAELALPWAQALLAEAGLSRAQLDAIAVGRGPGAFTGVRLAIGIAQGIALALDVPVLPVSTLEVLVRRAPADATRVLASIDARMGEVYAAAFAREGDGWRALDEERVLAPHAVALPDDAAHWYGVGTGFAAADGVLAQRLAPWLRGVDAQALPHAADVIALALPRLAAGQGMAAEKIEPAYLRNNVALTLEEQKAAKAQR
ncbi:tRNA (adenosine(37)-N6)-threonylcarbamoyltransferase complex dimerization subunit type 1 TsaB [Stenotrophomonas sp. HITSZ_GD]|uniref:tRNA (adenosine(37)-N6)-threonylcarbamoyltransferase complex dimerization subunit type 1 TsaB n=1 Tax=Stenotrophomonas sp. HITSZ_GD TaxID=3037248 RepID=UPI00240DD50D|nr:tRNA (adenosine(37)-N6)-threonylcarbamoyltransferase complex dimerization subunit type 1 TsaB [Stenotrophomonas sp. HITSZ_GD]MDG2525868.1 tRNA (adenosine(37)-N6)-threonylcarbamoyltransferase complex dimerization subunit type 1 TsaB [Stenotrophomonas sp. HITSZ_GD]